MRSPWCDSCASARGQITWRGLGVFYTVFSAASAHTVTASGLRARAGTRYLLGMTNCVPGAPGEGPNDDGVDANRYGGPEAPRGSRRGARVARSASNANLATDPSG